MEMEHNFTVPAPVDTVWQALLDPERVAPCFPGATITSASGDEFAGTVKVRLGPISLQYKGNGKFTDTDASARRAVIEASGKDARGNGTAAATVTATLAEGGSSTDVKVATDLQVTGRPAQFGRGMLDDVGSKIIGQFADCLADTLGTEQQSAQTQEEPASAPAAESATASEAASATSSADQPTPARAAEPSSPPERATASIGEQQPPAASAPSSAGSGQQRATPRPSSDEINLLDTAGAPVLKRVAPVAAGVAALLLVLLWFRRRRRR